MSLRKIIMYTDGACRSSRRGGWGCVLIDPSLKYEKEISGVEYPTTNNRMEITGVIKGLEALFQPCEVTVYSDSKYVVNAIELDWIKKWMSNGWNNYEGKPVVNQDLWEKLWSLCGIHKVTMKWVKGHAGDPRNEQADRLATGAIDGYRQFLTDSVNETVYDLGKIYTGKPKRNRNKKR